MDEEGFSYGVCIHKAKVTGFTCKRKHPSSQASGFVPVTVRGMVYITLYLPG